MVVLIDDSLKRWCIILFMKKIAPFVRTLSAVHNVVGLQRKMGFTTPVKEDINVQFARLPSVVRNIRLSRLVTFVGFKSLSRGK